MGQEQEPDVPVTHGRSFCRRGLLQVVAARGSSQGTRQAGRSVDVPWAHLPQMSLSACCAPATPAPETPR